jgi:4-amino-4-deoxy-L-arabinose transferase-like glycosyltransferase
VVNSGRKWLSLLLLIIGVSVILRLGLALFLGNDIDELRGGTYDQISYDTLAVRVSDGYGFTFGQDWWPATKAGEPTAHWSYLYVLVLAGIYSFIGHFPVAVRLLQAVLVGVLTPWLIYRIGRRTFNKQAGLAAAAISAVYAYFIMFGASLMTEALYIVSILWMIDVAMRLATDVSFRERQAAPASNRRRMLLGLELGLAITLSLLLRQVILGFIAVLLLWLLWVIWRRASVRSLIAPLAIAFVTIALLLTPVLVRNYLAFDRIMALNSNAGFAYFWSNHPIYGTRFESVLSDAHGVTYQDLIPADLLDLDEASLDRALLVRGLEFVREEPGRYILLSLSRIPVYFLFWPKSDSTLLSNAARLMSFALFLPAMLYGLYMSLRQLISSRGEKPAQDSATSSHENSNLNTEFILLLLSFILLYSFIHIVSWANVRYRLPVDAVLIVFAGYGLWDIYLRLRKRRLVSE